MNNRFTPPSSDNETVEVGGDPAVREDAFGFGNNTSAFDRMHSGFGSSSGSAKQAERQYGPPPEKGGVKPAYISPKPYTKTVEHTPSADFLASDTSNLQVAQKVEHQKFGFGEVVKMEGSAHNPIATVKFEHNGEKKIMLNYAKLRIVD